MCDNPESSAYRRNAAAASFNLIAAWNDRPPSLFCPLGLVIIMISFPCHLKNLIQAPVFVIGDGDAEEEDQEDASDLGMLRIRRPTYIDEQVQVVR
jgi:hypothetical protein